MRLRKYLKVVLAYVFYPLSVCARWLSQEFWSVHLAITSIRKPLNSDLPDLTPTNQPKRVDGYIKILKEYIDRPRVRFIALMAPYAGGKSSLLRCFFNRYPYRVKTVSLASVLQEDNSKGESPPGKEDFELNETQNSKRNKIDYSLYQQLMMGRQPSRWMELFLAPLALFAIFAVVHTLSKQPKSISDIVEPIEIGTWHGCLAFFALILILSFTTLIIADAIRLARNYHLAKLNPAKGEVELKEKPNPSLLNIHIKDICIHILRARIQVIVFEDLDRFECEEVFLKLRELNKLINDARPWYRFPIKFICAVSDDVFNERSDRTKHFDAIIPLLPTTNAHSSLAHFRRLLRDSIDEEKDKHKTNENNSTPLEQVIYRVAAFINDMRLINNIVADFKITLDTLRLSHGESLPIHKVFAFTVYRNYHPEDFSALHDQQGMLFEAINKDNR